MFKWIILPDIREMITSLNTGWKIRLTVSIFLGNLSSYFLLCEVELNLSLSFIIVVVYRLQFCIADHYASGENFKSVDNGSFPLTQYFIRIPWRHHSTGELSLVALEPQEVRLSLKEEKKSLKKLTVIKKTVIKNNNN